MIIPCPPPTRKSFRNLSGRRFGRILVQAYYGKKFCAGGRYANYYYTCRCDCGTIKLIQSSGLVSGGVVSCGCKKYRHGKTSSAAYRRWSHMLGRCYNPTDGNYERYGKRGLRVCDRWKDFINFYEDMGDPPAGLTIERRANESGYCKENCYWGTATQQARNRRSNRLITHNGMTKCVTEWEDYFGMKRNIIGNRLAHGWSVERAMTQPTNVKVKRSQPESNKPPSP